MYKFIIQKIGEEISSDSATLIESINYHKFIGNNNYEYMVVKDLNELNSFQAEVAHPLQVGDEYRQLRHIAFYFSLCYNQFI